MSAHVLLVEDSQTQSLRAQLLLRKAGYEVTTAYHGKEALQLALENPPDVVVTDINMPEMDGYRLCARLKTLPKTRSIPVILLTARDELHDIIRGLQVGADGFVTKPFEAAELYERLARVLERPRPETQREGLALDRSREQILEQILASFSSISNSDVIGVLLLDQTEEAGFLFFLSMLPLADQVVDQFVERMLADLKKQVGRTLAPEKLTQRMVVRDPDLPPVTQPFSVYMALPLEFKGKIVGLAGAASTVNALRVNDVKLFRDFTEVSAEAFARVVQLGEFRASVEA